MHARFDHATGDILEAYSLGTLSEQEVEFLEEHLLVCPECQDRLAEADVFVHRMQAAAARLRTETGKQSDAQVRLWQRVAWRSTVLAATAVGCVILLVWIALASKEQPQPVAIVLQTIRGTQNDSTAQAPGGRPLKLEADVSGLRAEGQLRLELVDAGGGPVQYVDVTSQNERVSMVLESGLRPGVYWLRLYDAAPGHELLREYALRVK